MDHGAMKGMASKKIIMEALEKKKTEGERKDTDGVLTELKPHITLPVEKVQKGSKGRCMMAGYWVEKKTITTLLESTISSQT